MIWKDWNQSMFFFTWRALRERKGVGEEAKRVAQLIRVEELSPVEHTIHLILCWAFIATTLLKHACQQGRVTLPSLQFTQGHTHMEFRSKSLLLIFPHHYAASLGTFCWFCLLVWPLQSFHHCPKEEIRGTLHSVCSFHLIPAPQLLHSGPIKDKAARWRIHMSLSV